MLFVDRSGGVKLPKQQSSCADPGCAPLARPSAHYSFCGGAAAMEPSAQKSQLASTSSFVAAVMGPLVANALSAMAQLLLHTRTPRASLAAAGPNICRNSGSSRNNEHASSKAAEEKPCPPAPRAIPTNTRPRPPPPAERPAEPLPGINKQLFTNNNAAGAPDSELEQPNNNATTHSEELVQTKIQELLQPRSPFAAKVQVAIKDFAQRFGNDCPLPLFALALSDAAADLGVKVILRTVTETKQYWSGKSGRSFLMCMSPSSISSASAPGSSMTSCLIIDRGFRDAFTTPMMTPRYRQMCASLPEVFVGQPAQLTSLLHLACYETDVMFRALGRHVPPWRAFPAASARWLSSACSDVIVPSTSKRGREAAGASTREAREFLALCERMKQRRAHEPSAADKAALQIPTITGFHPQTPFSGGPSDALCLNRSP